MLVTDQLHSAVQPDAQPPNEVIQPPLQHKIFLKGKLHYLAILVKFLSYDIPSFVLLEPKMHDFNTIVVPKVAAHWEDIAYALDYEIPTVDQISNKYKENPTKCCKELFKDWLVTSNGVKPKIWQTLLDKLKELQQLNKVTEEITKELIQKDSQDHST